MTEQINPTANNYEEEFNRIMARQNTAIERVKSLRRAAVNRLNELKAGLPEVLSQWGLGNIDDTELNQKMLDMAIVSQLAAINDSTLETAANKIGNICNREIKSLKKDFAEQAN